MKTPKVFVVILRQPRRHERHEKRMDPFWEFGSLGSTGCHMANLLNPNKAKERLQGARLAFAQGGPKEGFKLVMLTPPVRIADWKEPCEALWKPRRMPFRYADAPLLVDYDGRSDFPFLKAKVRRGNCASPVQQFSSIFRSSAEPLREKHARVLIRIHDDKVKKPRKEMIARSYLDALPYPPPVKETRRQRKQTYLAELAEAQPRTSGKEAGSCHSKASDPRQGKKTSRRCK